MHAPQSEPLSRDTDFSDTNIRIFLHCHNLFLSQTGLPLPLRILQIKSTAKISARWVAHREKVSRNSRRLENDMSIR